MSFLLFLLVTATLLIRPSEQFAELQGAHIYEALIVLCLLCSFGSILEQFTIANLETRPISICIFGLLFAVLLSHFSQSNFAAASDSGLAFVKILAYYLLLVGNVTTVVRLRVFIACLGIFAVIFVALAVLQYHEVIKLPEPALAQGTTGSRGATAAYVKDMEYDAVSGKTIEFKRLRGTGIFRDPNDICLLLTMGVFIALYGFSDKQQGDLRLLWLGPFVFFIYALSLTHSRGGLLSMIAGFMALFYARFGWRTTLALGLPFFFAALAFFGGRMASISTSEGTGQERIQLWSDSISAIQSAPLFGLGLNELSPVVGKTAHNSFICAYAELGLFGGTLFFGAFFVALLLLLRLLHFRSYVADLELRRLLPYLMAMLIAYWMGILSLSRIDAIPTYLLLGLVVIAGNLAANMVPALSLRFDSRLMQRMALASMAWLAASYMFVRVFKV